MPTALKRRQPTFSFKKTAESSVRISGSAKNTAIASARGIYLTAVKKHVPPNPISAPRTRLPVRYVVRNAAKPPMTINTKNIITDWMKNRIKVTVAGGILSIMASHLPMASISGSNNTESTMIAMPFTCASTPTAALPCISPLAIFSPPLRLREWTLRFHLNQPRKSVRFDFRHVSGANPVADE